MIDYLIEMECICVCALLCFYDVKFYVPVYYHVNYCMTARALLQCQRYVLKKCSIIIIIFANTYEYFKQFQLLKIF